MIKRKLSSQWHGFLSWRDSLTPISVEIEVSHRCVLYQYSRKFPWPLISELIVTEIYNRTQIEESQCQITPSHQKLNYTKSQSGEFFLLLHVLFKGLGYPQKGPIELWEDNSSCIQESDEWKSEFLTEIGQDMLTWKFNSYVIWFVVFMWNLSSVWQNVQVNVSDGFTKILPSGQLWRNIRGTSYWWKRVVTGDPNSEDDTICVHDWQ